MKVGRRILTRTRSRSGNIAVEDDGDELHNAVDPVTPDSDVTGETGGFIGIDIGLGIRL